MTYETFLSELELIVQEVSRKLEQRRSGVAGAGSVAQLQYMYEELSTLGVRLQQHALPPPTERALAAARIVTDSWPFSEPLGERICRLNYLYQNEIRP